MHDIGVIFEYGLECVTKHPERSLDFTWQACKGWYFISIASLSMAVWAILLTAQIDQPVVTSYNFYGF